MNTKPTTWGRSAALGAVFAVTATAALTAASFGVSKEQSVAETCAHENWPYIAAGCLTGASAADVRIVPLDRTSESVMAERFAIAFE